MDIFEHLKINKIVYRDVIRLNSHKYIIVTDNHNDIANIQALFRILGVYKLYLQGELQVNIVVATDG